jgi:hypothetical protein
MEDSLRKKLVESLLTEKDNRQILIDKEGVSQEIADWAHNLSDKLSIWIVKSLKDKYANEMGRAFESDKVDLDDYYKTLDSDYKDIIDLTKKTNKPNMNLKRLSFDEALDLVGKYRYIEAWLDDPATDIQAELGQGFLQNKTWDEAVAMADEWHESLTAGGSVEDLLDEKDEIIHTFDNGFQWVLRRSNTCSKSRESMGHCATASKPNMYLLRLVKDSSEYVTVDWDPNEKSSVQIKGKLNKKPISKLHPYIAWLIQNKEWGGIDKLKTDTGHLPHTNFHLGELNPDLAAKIYGENPNIMNVHSMLEFTPNPNKAKLIANLFKYDSFVKKLIPYGFSQFFDMVDNKDSISAIVIKNPTFLEKMNRYRGALTYTLEEMIEASKYKDKLIEALLSKDGLIDMLDAEGAEVLINNHSDPDEVRDIIFQHEFDDEPEEEEDELQMNETIRRRSVLREMLMLSLKNRGFLK